LSDKNKSLEYRDSMSLLPLVTFANPNTELYAAAGSGGSVSSFGTLTVSSIISVGPPGQVLVYADADTKLKTSVDSGTSTIREVMTNGSGTQVTPALVFKPETGSFIIQDTSNNKSLLIATNGDDLSLPGTVNISSIAMPANPTISFGTSFVVGRDGDSLSMGLSQIGNDNVSVTLTTPNNDNDILIGADGGAGKIEVLNGPLQVFASSLDVYSTITTFALGVSSINGAGVGDAPSTIGFSAANFPGGAGTVPISNVPFAMTNSFAVDPAHRYRVSFEAAYANADATGPNYTTAYISGTSPSMYITTIDNRDAIPAMNDLRGSASAVFVPNSSPCQIITANSSVIAATGMTVNNVTGVVLEDLGPA
jgi:hypothetical protein